MNNENDLISIIMPAYNAEKTLAQAVNSALAQSYRHFELIIINDCSDDRTQEIAQTLSTCDPRIRVLTNTENRGASKARHRGAEQARGQWLAFLDSDDEWTADKLEKQVSLRKEKNARLVFTGSGFMDQSGARKDWIMHVPQQVGYRKLLKQNVVSNSSVLIHKETYLKYEAIGNDFHEDFVCWLRLLRTGELAYGIDEPLLIYRLSPASKSGNKLKSAKLNWNAYRATGLNRAEAAYYMIFYTINSLRKYKNLR